MPMIWINIIKNTNYFPDDNHFFYYLYYDTYKNI